MSELGRQTVVDGSPAQDEAAEYRILDVLEQDGRNPNFLGSFGRASEEHIAFARGERLFLSIGDIYQAVNIRASQASVSENIHVIHNGRAIPKVFLAFVQTVLELQQVSHGCQCPTRWQFQIVEFAHPAIPMAAR